MNDELIGNGDESSRLSTNDGLIIYRLARVERTTESIEASLKIISEIQSDVKKNSWRIENLEKSRERTIAALTVIATSVFLLLIQQVLTIVEGG